MGPTDRFEPGSHTCLTIGNEPVVLVNNDGSFFAFENRCPHAGRPLDEGERTGLILTCPFHGWTYNIKTGKNIDDPYDEQILKTYPVRIQDGQVQIQTNQDPGNPE